jgi:hypothetical protein
MRTSFIYGIISSFDQIPGYSCHNWGVNDFRRSLVTSAPIGFRSADSQEREPDIRQEAKRLTWGGRFNWIKLQFIVFKEKMKDANDLSRSMHGTSPNQALLRTWSHFFDYFLAYLPIRWNFFECISANLEIPIMIQNRFFIFPAWSRPRIVDLCNRRHPRKSLSKSWIVSISEMKILNEKTSLSKTPFLGEVHSTFGSFETFTEKYWSTLDFFYSFSRPSSEKQWSSCYGLRYDRSISYLTIPGKDLVGPTDTCSLYYHLDHSCGFRPDQPKQGTGCSINI